jgi:hypothetical protein
MGWLNTIVPVIQSLIPFLIHIILKLISCLKIVAGILHNGAITFSKPGMADTSGNHALALKRFDLQGIQKITFKQLLSGCLKMRFLFPFGGW